MADRNGEYPTVIGADATFKGELAFEKGVRIEGSFEGHIKSSGTLHVAEGAKVSATVEATNVKIEGECKGDITVSEKLQLLATANMEGDLRTNRLEIADGAVFVGNVVVGQGAGDSSTSRTMPQKAKGPQPRPPTQVPDKPQVKHHPKPQPQPPGVSRPQPQDIAIPAGNS